MAFEGEDFDTNTKEEENLLNHSEKDSPPEPNASNTCDESKRKQMKKPKSSSVDHNTREHFPFNGGCETQRRKRSHTEQYKSYMKDKRHICSFCGKDFLYRSQFNIHMQCHTNDGSFVCEICDATFVKKRVLQNHMISHSEEKLYTCEICNKNFRMKNTLKLHSVVHIDDKPHKCIVCQKTFKRLIELKSHSLTHSDNKPHKCIVCQKTFKRLCNLRSHSNTHSDTKHFGCEICDKKFKHINNLYSHISKHNTVQKEHPCIICGKTFRTEAFLNIHSLIHNTSMKGQTKHINTFERDQLVEVSELDTSSPNTRIWEKDIGVHEFGKFRTEGNLGQSTTESTIESDLSYILKIDFDSLSRTCFAGEDSKNKPIESNHPSIIRNIVINFICKLCGTKIKGEASCPLNTGIRSYRCSNCDVTYTQVEHDETSEVSQII